MPAYHINKDGNIVACRAKEGNCPYGGNIDGLTDVTEVKELKQDIASMQDIKNEKDYSKSNYNGFESAQRADFVAKITSYALKYWDTSIHETLPDNHNIYKPERVAKHMEILDDLMDKVHAGNVQKNKKLLMSAGLPGAGKTTTMDTAKNILGDVRNDYVTVNADDFKEILAEKDMISTISGLGPMECSQFVHKECSHLASVYAQRLRSEGYNILYDCTAKNYEQTKARLMEYISDGYKASDMTVVYVDIPVSTSIERTKSRYQRSLNETGDGRTVPASVIEMSKAKGDLYNSSNAETVKKLFDDPELDIKTPIVFDNSDKPTQLDPTKFFSNGRMDPI